MVNAGKVNMCPACVFSLHLCEFFLAFARFPRLQNTFKYICNLAVNLEIPPSPRAMELPYGHYPRDINIVLRRTRLNGSVKHLRYIVSRWNGDTIRAGGGGKRLRYRGSRTFPACPQLKSWRCGCEVR
jgi:hypothetical protein